MHVQYLGRTVVVERMLSIHSEAMLHAIGPVRRERRKAPVIAVLRLDAR